MARNGGEVGLVVGPVIAGQLVVWLQRVGAVPLSCRALYDMP